MTPISSAADAVSPAWQRTREVLFAPRSFRLFFKLAAVATLAEVANGINLNVGTGSNNLHLPPGSNPLSQGAMAAAMMFILAFVVIALLVSLALFYCGSRMQLVMIDIVGRGETQVAPIWRRYGGIVWRWIGLKLIVFFSLIAAMAVLALPVILYFVFYAGAHAKGLGGSGGFIAAAILGIIALVLVFLVLLLAFVAAFCLVADFVPVFMALENTSIRDSCGYVVELCRRETGQVVLYLLLRLVLGMAFGLGFIIVVLAAVLVAAIPLGGGGAGMYFMLHNGGAGAHCVLLCAAVLGALMFAAWLLVVYICCAGIIGTFFRAYALYFLGARFRSVGNLLYGVPQAVFTQPAYPPLPDLPFGPSPI